MININKKIEELSKLYFETEEKLLNEISKLERFSDECNCDNKEKIQFIHNGNFDEIQTFCLNCGGYLESD